MKISITINGERYDLDVQPLRRLLDVLREDLRLTGTKEGCGEGECGACAVHLDGVLVNACQIPVYQAHGCQVLTIEGLGTQESPDPLQTAFVTAGAVQCGFCTPGLLMASRALLANNPDPSANEIRAGLAGNLCRCTGYGRVVEAVKSTVGIPSSLPQVSVSKADPPRPAPDDAVQVFMPNSLSEALDVLATEDCTVLAGGTDLMAAFHAGNSLPDKVLDISRLPELTGINFTPRGVILGATVCYTELQSTQKIAQDWPALAQAARLVGAPAVQNVGTVGGNLVNASPGADLVPALAALGGEVVLVARHGERRVPVREFYRGYRECDLKPGELVQAVELPRPLSGSRQAFYKAGTRRAQSIARVNLAASAQVGPDGCLQNVKLVAGSVGPTIITLHRTMAYLEGKAITQSGLAAEAGNLAIQEVAPMDDVRATADYRRTVVAKLVARFLGSCRVG